MDLALLTSLTARQPLIILSNSDRAPFELAQICSAYSLNCQTIEPQDLPRPGTHDNDDDDVNVLIVKDLHAAPRNAQVPALELIRKKARSGALFTLVALLPLSVREKGAPYLTPHLNDLFFFAYTHSETAAPEPPSPLTRDAIAELQTQVGRVKTSAEIRRYTHDIVSFLRLNRACGGGVSAVGTRQLGVLSKVLAVLNGLNYVTPSLVAMAARKIYLHRLVITTPENERSLQWGSDLDAVKEALEGMTAEKLVEEVLETVECPL